VQRLAALLDIAPLDSISDYPRFPADLDRAEANLAGDEVAIRDQVWETERAFREATAAVARNREEYKVAGTAASNVPRDQRVLRDRMCAAPARPSGGRCRCRPRRPTARGRRRLSVLRVRRRRAFQ